LDREVLAVVGESLSHSSSQKCQMLNGCV
jgi:hypothetical protein